MTRKEPPPRHWLRTHPAWKILLVLLGPGSLVLFIIYRAVNRDNQPPGLQCQLSEDGAMLALFFLFAGLTLTTLILAGEVLNRIDAEEHHHAARNGTAIAISTLLLGFFAGAILYVFYRC